MTNRTCIALAVLSFMLTAAAAARAEEMVLFPFDDHTIPFSAGLRLNLVPGKAPGVKPPIVLDRGAPGAPDEGAVRFATPLRYRAGMGPFGMESVAGTTRPAGHR